jgi:hypothetical protein
MADNKNSKVLDRIWEISVDLVRGLISSLEEIALSIWKAQVPEIRLTLLTVIVCIFFKGGFDYKILKYFSHENWVMTGKLRQFTTTLIAVLPWLIWGWIKNLRRLAMNKKLKFVFESNRVTSGLGLCPDFLFDEPLDSNSRKLRVWANGMPLHVLKENKSKLEDGLGATVSKISWADDHKKMIDLIYSFGSLPDFFVPENVLKFKDFKFPIGKNCYGEVIGSLKEIPHYLVAGETGTGKSTFIRMMIEILLINNRNLEVYFLDFKGGIEAQSIAEDPRLHVIATYEEAVQVIKELDLTLTQRGKDIAGTARDIDGFNKKQTDTIKKMKRILIVVDEVSEIVPKIKAPNKSEMAEISFGINRIARLGRALGLHLVVGTQKPDAKNLDPTVKANLAGIVCFAMSHPTQSMVVLGDGRAADLNAEIKGRAIWKHGSYTEEIQTPFLTDSEIAEAKLNSEIYWGQMKKKSAPEIKEVKVNEVESGKSSLLVKTNLAKDSLHEESSGS